MIEYKDLQRGDIVTTKRGAFEIKGPVYVDVYGTPYFDTNDGYMIIKPHEFVSAVRDKKLPTLPGSVINNVVEYDGWRGGLMVLDNDGNWHSSDHAVRPEHIVEWEEV